MSHITTAKIKLKSVDPGIFEKAARNTGRRFNLSVTKNGSVTSMYKETSQAQWVFTQQNKKKKLLPNSDMGFGYNIANNEINEVGEHWGAYGVSFNTLTTYLIDEYLKEQTITALQNAGYSVSVNTHEASGVLIEAICE